MKLNYLRPVLLTAKLEETITFYTSILGFTVTDKNEEWGWASLHRDGVHIMLSKPNEHMAFSKPVFTGSFYINVNNVDDLWAQLNDKVQICYGIEDFDWQMREFAIYDNNGYVLQFGEEIG